MVAPISGKFCDCRRAQAVTPRQFVGLRDRTARRRSPPRFRWRPCAGGLIARLRRVAARTAIAACFAASRRCRRHRRRTADRSIRRRDRRHRRPDTDWANNAHRDERRADPIARSPICCCRSGRIFSAVVLLTVITLWRRCSDRSAGATIGLMLGTRGSDVDVGRAHDALRMNRRTMLEQMPNGDRHRQRQHAALLSTNSRDRGSSDLTWRSRPSENLALIAKPSGAALRRRDREADDLLALQLAHQRGDFVLCSSRLLPNCSRNMPPLAPSTIEA